MDITENNKLIAKFMGFTDFPDRYEMRIYEANNFNYSGFRYEGLKYNSSWDWLIPVVEKIESLEKGRFTIAITHSIISIYDNDTDETIEVKQKPLTKIEAVYNACVEFIKWYNQQSK